MVLIPSSFMALIMFPLFISLVLLAAEEPQLPTSTIAAAPALFPGSSPLTSPPALSPDMIPLFPSPAGSGPSPSESSIPTIPSSPSPPNPDAIGAPGPGTALSPTESLPVAAAHQIKVSGFLSSAIVSALLLLLCW